MKQLFTALACISVLGFVSCQKDINDELTQETNPADTLLSKILTYGGQSCLTEYKFTYNDNNLPVFGIFYGGWGG
jgi:hypothetical protein